MNYGKFWQEADLKFYKFIHKGRKVHHKKFMKWLDKNFTGKTVLEIGCGYGVFYPKFFEARGSRYHGVDLAVEAINHCRETCPGTFYCGDATKMSLVKRDGGKFVSTLPQCDLVFSQGVIDNTPNMDEFLFIHYVLSLDWIYATACRGYWPELKGHIYNHNEDQEVYYNDLSVPQAIETLNRCGCKGITVESFKGEAIIVARK